MLIMDFNGTQCKLEEAAALTIKEEPLQPDSSEFENILDTEEREDKKIIVNEDLIGIDELAGLQVYSKCENVAGDEEEYIPEEFAPEPKDYVPLSAKERIVALVAAHPKWSLQSLRKRGACPQLKQMSQIYRWRDDVKRGGTHFDKWKTIDSKTYERFLRARQNSEQVTTQTLQQWAMKAALPFLSDSFHFTASSTWVQRFKKHHRIRQRDIKK